MRRSTTSHTATAPTDVMADDTDLELHVRVDFGGETIHGTVEDATGSAVEFSGWLGLMSAFDSARLTASRRVARQPDHVDEETR